MGSITVGVDVGQRVDPTAIAVMETSDDGQHHYVRHLSRLPLGTKYPAVAQRLCTIAEKLQQAQGTEESAPGDRDREPWLLMDATGVGLPVVDLARATLERRQTAAAVRVVACYFTHGDRCGWTHPREAQVGKAYLVSALQAALQQGRLHFPPAMRDAQQLQDELLNYEIRVDENANDKYGAFAVGKHDDEVTAVGLALVGAVKRRGGNARIAFAAVRPEFTNPATRAWAQRMAGEPMDGEQDGTDEHERAARQVSAAEREREEALQERVQTLANIMRSLNGGRMPNF